MIASKSYTCAIFLSFVIAMGVFLVPEESYAVQISEQDTDMAITRISSHTGTESSSVQTASHNGIRAEGIFFEKTVIMEFTNTSNATAKTFTFWLGTGYSFESFKTESGWTGKKTPEGTIVFTTLDQLGINESVKFGVKTNESNPGINWNAVDGNGNQIGIGKTTAESPKDPSGNTNTGNGNGNGNVNVNTSGIFADSVFRTIPEKPKVGSTIRVIGQGFGASQQFSFYIDTIKLGTFLSDRNGNFITTMKIPDDKEADRVNFMVIDADGNEKRSSLRIGSNDNRVPDSKDVKLTIRSIASTLHRGDSLDISGTAQPGSAVTASIKNPDGNVINARIAEVDSKGEWSLPEPIIIPLDAEFGKYSAEISDGKDSILRTWEIKSDKVIIIEPAKIKFEPGEVMRYSGTALANKPIEFVLKDPLGKEIFSQIVSPDNGVVEFEYSTDHSSAEGTYTLVASQNGEKEFIFTGLGQLPAIPINIEFDKLNYITSDTATISLTGKASETVSLLIVDQSDQSRPEIPITLGPDGIGTYLLDLSGYRSGIYTAVISKGSTQNSEIFTVGLKISIGEIKINPTKLDYHPGDSMLILGETDNNSILTIALIDPNNNEIKVKDTFSDKNGRISDDSFRIPLDAEPGSWTIHAKSGAHFHKVAVSVTSMQEGMIVWVEESQDLPGSNLESITIKVAGASPGRTVIVEIISPTGDMIDELEQRSTGRGEIALLWIIPDDTEPGMYTIKVNDSSNKVETKYELK